MQNYQTWLQKPDVVRIALVQVKPLVNNVSTTLYLSTHGVTVDSQQYLPIISSQITIDESISTSYSASISYGDIELANNNGDYDSWLDYIWTNKSVDIYIGEMPASGTTSVIGNFELIFSGLIDDIDSKGRTTLNLKIRDKLEKLNTSISETLLGNYLPLIVGADTTTGILAESSGIFNQYRNNLKPLCFGEVHNITPLLTEPTLLQYMVNSTAVEQIIEVRDNGLPVQFTQTAATGSAIPPGSFRLLKSPVGVVTCSVQGVKNTVNIATATSTSTYANTAANTIATILKLYGQTLAYTEIDANSFTTLGTQAIGVYIPDRVNVLVICQEIAKSCGLILTTTRAGTVKLVDLSVPTSAAVNITESDMLLNTLAITQRPDVIAAVRLGYAKNWTVQNALTTQLPEQHKNLYATEWLESLAKDDTVKANYSLTTEPVLESSYLIDKAQADTIAQNKLDLFKIRRKVVTMTCTAKFLSVQVGYAVTVTAKRFSLNSGKLGRVISTKPNWLRGTIEIGVLI
jgi:hypothetical protein